MYFGSDPSVYINGKRHLMMSYSDPHILLTSQWLIMLCLMVVEWSNRLVMLCLMIFWIYTKQSNGTIMFVNCDRFRYLFMECAILLPYIVILTIIVWCDMLFKFVDSIRYLRATSDCNVINITIFYKWLSGMIFLVLLSIQIS